jgi:hypothetical protein
MSARGPETPLAPYTAIVDVAERQLELARRGETDGLEPLAQTWRELLARVPSQPPAEAAALLEAALELNGQTAAELMRMQEALLHDIAITARASRAARGYAGRARRSSRLDRRA